MASKAGSRRPTPWRIFGWAVPAGLLSVPWLAQWPWSAADFIVAAVIFAIVGVTFELALRASGDISYRLGSAAAIATTFLLVWIDLAVGIIGNENNPLNLMFFGVIAVALVGGIVARFEADGMARAMTVAAVLQALIGAVVFLFDGGRTEPPGRFALLLLIEFFAVAWLVSAWLFRRAAQQLDKRKGGAF